LSASDIPKEYCFHKETMVGKYMVVLVDQLFFFLSLANVWSQKREILARVRKCQKRKLKW
jgi:hypothetical protein